MNRFKGFTLIEMLVVLAIIAILAAIVMPAFWTVRGSARATACRSNLAQIGRATHMYSQDYDGFYPHGIDQQDRYLPDAWSSQPAFEAELPFLPFAKDIVQPYLKSQQVFVCPADTGYDYDDFYGVPFAARPTSAEAFGSSYYYNTNLVVSGARIGAEAHPADQLLFFDATGGWHGTWVPPVRRYNVVFVDAQVKNVTAEQLESLRD